MKKKYGLVIGLLLTTCATHAQSRSECAVSAPSGWVAAALRWDGDCSAGHADGLGVLKELDGKGIKRLFFGQLAHGELQLGVIDQPDGYVAGRFEHGSAVPSGDRQTMISAFKQAAAAADAVAQRFGKAGNKASSQFYAAKAKALREQVD